MIRRVAVHEAAHAVVAARLGLPVETCSIAPDDVGVLIGSHPGEREAVLIALLAGGVAECVAVGDADELSDVGTPVGVVAGRCGSDWADRLEAYRAISRGVPLGLPGREREREIVETLARLEAAALRLIRSNWPAIERVADRLARDVELSAPELLALIEGASS